MTDPLPTDESLIKTDECWSTDESEFRYDSLGDLLDCCQDELEVGSVVYVGEQLPCDPSLLYDADDIVEGLGERAYDNHGEYAEDWPDVSREAKEELNALLTAWIAKHCQPTFYAVKNIRPYTVTAEDLQE